MTDIFREYSSGVQTKRDNLAVNFDKNTLRTNFLMFQNMNLPDEIIEKTFYVSDTYEWNLKQAREEINTEKIDKVIKCYLYRPFDKRWIYYSDAVIARPFKRVMRNFLNKNVAIGTSLKYPETKIFGVMATDLMGDIHSVADQTYFFPLYLYPKTKESATQKYSDSWGASVQSMMVFEPRAEYNVRRSNINHEFVRILTNSLGSEQTPDEIFYYIYAILYSPAYRKRYEEFLKIDFPRIPIPSNYEMFKKLSNVGKELIDLHLLKTKSLEKSEIGFPNSGSFIVDKVSYEEENLRVFINKEQYFEKIFKEVWEYRIGAYQVMEKYLKDRKKRKLSLDEVNHYIKAAKAIRLTIELQKRIDDIYRKM